MSNSNQSVQKGNAEPSDLIVNRCPLGCDSVCAQIWKNEVTGYRIICKCSCEHEKIASLVEEPETDAIQVTSC